MNVMKVYAISDSSFKISFQLTYNHAFVKSQPLARDTKKMSCPASITIRDIPTV